MDVLHPDRKPEARARRKRPKARDYLAHPLLGKLHADIQAGVRRHGQMRSWSWTSRS